MYKHLLKISLASMFNYHREVLRTSLSSKNPTELHSPRWCHYRHHGAFFTPSWHWLQALPLLEIALHGNIAGWLRRARNFLKLTPDINHTFTLLSIKGSWTSCHVFAMQHKSPNSTLDEATRCGMSRHI